MSFTEFRGYSKDLDELPNNIRSSLSTIIFSKRDSIFSVCAVTRDPNTIKFMCAGINFPSLFFKKPSNRWGVDLESLKTDKIRIYSFLPKTNNIRLYGFYVDKDGNVFEKKIYKQYQKNSLIIDRFDGQDNLINEGEIEKECNDSVWSGPNDLINKAKTYRYEYKCMHKTFKNQTYLVIHDKSDIYL